MLELPSDPFNFLEEEAMNGVCHLFNQQADPLIFSSNAECQWVCCSQIESHKS